MSSQRSKRNALQQARAWNPDPEHVKADLFVTHPFFDPEDKAQVKYELLRHREVERAPLEVSCREFGFTRESYRHLLERFRSEGMGGLFERKRGRRNPLKANDQVRRWLRHEHARDPNLGPEELARLCHEQSGVSISRRTVYRVLAEGGAQKKNAARNFAPTEGDGFLCWGGELQRCYERWREAALAGGEVGAFLQWGMALLAPGYFEGTRRVCQLRRCRASVRAGEFSLGELLLDLGIVGSASSLPATSLYWMEVPR